MNQPVVVKRLTFLQLLVWELQQVYRRPLLWLAVAILLIAMVWGALVGAKLHEAQSAAIRDAQSYEKSWEVDIVRRAALYATEVQPNLPYWQDPTDIAGFSRYFLKKHTFKPHLSLSPLSVGISDLAPSRLPVQLETPFASEPVYDFINPRSLVLGQFDMAFVVTYLVPLLILLLCGLLGTAERDRGALRLIAAQAIRPQYWLSARVLSIAVYTVPLISCIALFSLYFATPHIAQAIPQLLTAIIAIQIYSVFWFAIAFFVLSFWPHAASALGSMIGLWAGLLIGLPLLLNTVMTLYLPSLSPLTYLNEYRHINDIAQSQQKDIIADAFANSETLKNFKDKIPTLDYATKQIFLVPELERRLQPLRDRFEQDRKRREHISEVVEFLAPGLTISKALSIVAGTNSERQQEFVQQTRAYQQQLRAMFYPLMQLQISSPTERPVGSSGRYNFTSYEKIPVFNFQDAPVAKQLLPVFSLMAALSTWSFMLLALTLFRIRHWPQDL